MKKLIAAITILNLGFSQDSLEIISKINECATLKSDLARLVCYDELAKNQMPVKNDKQEPKSEIDIGSWQVQEKINPIDDSKTFSLILFSESGKNQWGKPIVLFLRYQSGQTSAYLNWGTYLGSEAYVLTRLGSEKAKTSQWGMSTTSKATFYPANNIDFIKELKLYDKAVFQVTPYGENPITAIFNLDGLSKVIESYSYTGW